MLGKLLKYEIPAMGRKLLPLYAAWIATALFLGLGTQSAASKSGFVAVLSGLLYGAVATAIVVMSVVMIIQRYSGSLLGDEAYFNHTLPVSAAAHIGNKLISATIWVIATAFVAILTGLFIMLGVGFVEGFESLRLQDLHFPKGFWLLMLEVLILVIASIVKSVMQIYAAITIGHQAQNHTTLASIGAYIGVLVFESTVTRIFVGLLSTISPKINGLLQGGNGMYGADGFLNISSIFFPALLATAALSAIYFFVCKYLMEKRLNLA